MPEDEGQWLDKVLGGESLEAPGPGQQEAPFPGTTASKEAGTEEDLTKGERRLMLGAEVVGSLTGSRAGGSAVEPLASRLVSPTRKGLTRVAGRSLGAAVGAEVGGAASDIVTGADWREEFLRRAAEGGLGEALGAGISKSARYLADPFETGVGPASYVGERLGALRAALAKKVGMEPQLRLPSDMEEVKAAQEMLNRQGATLTAEQVRTDSPWLQRLAGLVRETGPMQRAHIRSEERGSVLVQDWVKRAGAKDPRFIGDVAQGAVENVRDIHRAFTREKFTLLEERLAAIGSPVSVDIRPLWKSGGAELERAGVAFRPGLRRSAKLIQQEGTVVPQEVAPGIVVNQRMPYLSFDEAQDLRSALREAASGREPMPGVNQGFAKKLLAQLDTQMDAAKAELETLGHPEITQLYDDAIAASRMGHTQFNNSVIRGWLTQVEPERVYEGFVRAGRPTRIAMMRRIYEKGASEGVVPPTAWADVQSRFYQDVLDKSVKAGSEGRLVDGTKLLDNIKGFGDEALNELFPGPKGARGIDVLMQRARGLQIAQRGSEAGGQMAVNIMQARGMYLVMAGAAGAGYYGGGTMGAIAGPTAVVMIGPRALGHILSDRVFVNNLMKGMGTRAGEASARVLGQLVVRAKELQEAGVPDLFVNQEVVGKVGADGELTPNLQDISRANRPQLTLTPQQREGLLR